MPNKIETNKRQLIADALMGILREIDLASGYNTQPYVTSDPDIALSPDLGQHVVYVHYGNEEAKEKMTGPRWLMEIQFVVVGYAWRGTGNAQEETNKLLQDVRNVVCANVGALKTAAGQTLDLDLGSVDVDDGAVLGDGLSGFAFEVGITYWAGAQW